MIAISMTSDERIGVPALPRTKPYIHATWLAKIMSGTVTCQWQYWFQTHNRLIEKQPSTFDMVGWQMDHTRLRTEVRQSLTARGVRTHAEVEIKFRVPEHDTVVSGKIDCLAIDGSRVKIYDCKTGKPRDSDQVQVMLYMFGLSTYAKFAQSRIEGMVIYRDQRLEIPYLREGFADDIAYYVALLDGDQPLAREPGRDCEFCNITFSDCFDRQETGSSNDILF